MENNILVLQSNDWEMLYINGELKSEGHSLSQGIERIIWFIEKSKEYNFNLEDIKFQYILEEDEKVLNDYRCSNDYLKDYQGDY